MIPVFNNDLEKAITKLKRAWHRDNLKTEIEFRKFAMTRRQKRRRKDSLAAARRKRNEAKKAKSQ